MKAGPPAQVATHLADLTACRDRDALDCALVLALRDLLGANGVAVYRLVGERGDERWLLRARLQAGQATASADAAWTAQETLPRASDAPWRQQACKTGTSVRRRIDDGHLFAVPLPASPAGTVLEIDTEVPLDAGAVRLVQDILRVHGNVQALLDYGERDTLTGLLNRKTFDDGFLKAVGEARQLGVVVDGERRAGPPPTAGHWLGIVDIDHFKRINDSCGHLIGDEVLLLLAQLMRAGFRLSDRLYRFGGEEFVILVRCRGESEARIAFERLRARVQAHAFPQAGRVTVSIGFTSVVPHDTPSAAFARADQAVYFAKGNGRNQVQSHAELVASGALDVSQKVGDVELF